MKYSLRSELPAEEAEAKRKRDREYHKIRKEKDSYKNYKKQHWLNNKQYLTQLTKVSTLKRKYGLSWEEFENLYETQNGLCAICNKEEEGRMLAVDHNHETGEVRGLLCGNCNRALGLFKDNPVLLERAKEYVS